MYSMYVPLGGPSLAGPRALVFAPPASHSFSCLTRVIFLQIGGGVLLLAVHNRTKTHTHNLLAGSFRLKNLVPRGQNK